MSSSVMAKSSLILPQLPLAPIQPLQLTACSAASVLPGSPPHRNSSPAMDDDASGSSNFGTENDSHNGQQQQQSFCLKWNNYQSNVTTTFKELLAEEDFVDITLTADGGALKAHKVVLSACSPYFRDILRGISAWQHPVIVLKDVPYSDLQGIVEFIYHGEVSVFQESLTSFLRTAQILRVKGLTEDTGNEKPSKNHLDNNTAVKTSSNKRSNSHVRKNARPIRARVASKRQANNSFHEPTSEAINNNSDEEVVEVAQQQLKTNSSIFNHLPSPPKRLSLLRTNNFAEGDIEDDIDEEEEEAEIDDVEDVEGEDVRASNNYNGSEDDEEEEEMSHPPVGSHQGAILNVSGLADALVNNPAEAAKILEQHHQLDKRQRQQFLMQGGDILQAGLDPDFLPVANSARKPFSLGLQTARILSPLSASKCQDANTRTKPSTEIGSKTQITDASGLSISFEKDGGPNRNKSSTDSSSTQLANPAISVSNYGKKTITSYGDILRPLIIPEPLARPMNSNNVDPSSTKSLPALDHPLTSAQVTGEQPSPTLCNGAKGSTPEKSETVPSNGKERIMCPVCRTIVVRRVYRRHYETMHCVQAPVTCQFCFKVFKHRYSLDCHQRQTHPLQRVTGRTTSSLQSVSPPKPVPEEIKYIPENVSKSNDSTNVNESNVNQEPETTAEPYSSESLSTTIALRKQRKTKSKSKEPETS